MAEYKYSIKEFKGDHMARAVGRSLPISSKQSIEICSYIRNKNTQNAKKMLAQAISLEKAVPFKRFNSDVGHKKGTGMASGRFPVKACTHFVKLIEAVEANAQFKGLSTANLVITHISAQKSSRPWRPGRKRRRKMKRTNVEIVVEERSAKESRKKETAKKEEKEQKEEKKEKEAEQPKIKTKTALEKKEAAPANKKGKSDKKTEAKPKQEAVSKESKNQEKKVEKE